MDWTVWEHPQASHAVCPIPTVHPIPLYHRMDWTDWEYPKASHAVCPIPTVHPITLYHGMDWTDWEYPKASHAVCPIPTVYPLYHGADWTEWGCPTVSHAVCPIPAICHGRDCMGTPQILLCYPYMYTVHPILLYCGWIENIRCTGMLCGTHKLVTLPTALGSKFNDEYHEWHVIVMCCMSFVCWDYLWQHYPGE